MGYTFPMPEEKEIFGLWEKEHVYLKEQESLQPEAFIQPPQIETQEILSRVGIILPKSGLPLGFLKFNPLDFIVEEIQKDDSLHTVEYEAIQEISGDPKPFVTADIVKIGISTLEAVKELGRNLNLKESQIGFAGIKDGDALTSQRISISGVRPEKLLSYPISNHFLKNLSYSPKLIKKGELNGNRFTILLRTQHPIDPNQIAEQLNDISENGFWNFYWLQRFGRNVLNHWYGLLLIKGKQERAVRSFFCDSGPFELPFVRHLRQQANEQFENWEAIIKLFEPLPYTFYYELRMLNFLKEFRHDYVGALRAIPEMTQMWIYAYTSFLTNKILSSYVATGQEPPSEIPLALSREPADMAPYQQYLESDKVAADFYKELSRLEFIKFAHRTIPSKIRPKINGFEVLPEGVVIDFNLNKGAYATTFLSHIFTLVESLPVPGWVQTKQYDLKNLLGTGSVENTLGHFGKYSVSKSDKITL